MTVLKRTKGPKTATVVVTIPSGTYNADATLSGAVGPTLKVARGGTITGSIVVTSGTGANQLFIRVTASDGTVTDGPTVFVNSPATWTPPAMACYIGSTIGVRTGNSNGSGMTVTASSMTFTARD